MSSDQLAGGGVLCRRTKDTDKTELEVKWVGFAETTWESEVKLKVGADTS